MNRDEKALKAARKIVKAQDRLLVAYRIGGQPPEWVFKDLERYRPEWDAYVTTEESRTP